MKKEQYIVYRTINNFPEIVYEFYKEKFNTTKHKPFLQPHDLIKYLNLLAMVDLAIERAIKYYEEKWNIVKVIDESGIVIKFV